MNRERELLVVEELRAAIACVYGGLLEQARTHASIAKRELDLEANPVERGLHELRRAYDIADDFEHGGRR